MTSHKSNQEEIQWDHCGPSASRLGLTLHRSTISCVGHFYVEQVTAGTDKKTVKPESNPEQTFDGNLLGPEKKKTRMATYTRAPWCKGSKSQNNEPCSVCVGMCVEMATHSHNETKLANTEHIENTPTGHSKVFHSKQQQQAASGT